MSALPISTHLEPRVASLEAEMSAIKGSLDEIKGELKLIASRKPERIPLGTWVAIIALGLGALGGWGVALLGPHDIHLAYTREAIADLRNRTTAIEAAVTPLRETFREIETQFHAARAEQSKENERLQQAMLAGDQRINDLSLSRHATADRLLKMLWKKLYGEDLPAENGVH